MIKTNFTINDILDLLQVLKDKAIINTHAEYDILQEIKVMVAQ